MPHLWQRQPLIHLLHQKQQWLLFQLQWGTLSLSLWPSLPERYLRLTGMLKSFYRPLYSIRELRSFNVMYLPAECRRWFILFKRWCMRHLCLRQRLSRTIWVSASYLCRRNWWLLWYHHGVCVGNLHPLRVAWCGSGEGERERRFSLLW